MNENKTNINWLACNMPTNLISIERGVKIGIISLASGASCWRGLDY